MGSSFLAGLHFDMRLNKGQMDGIGFRAGFGGINASGYTTEGNKVNFHMVTFPMGINHVLGKRRSSFIAEAGILPAYANFEGTLTFQDEPEQVDVDGFSFLGGYASLGYRFQPLRHGLFFQAAWDPDDP